MTNNTSENTNKQTVKRKSVAREYTEAILIALLLALFIRTFFVQAFKIPSGTESSSDSSLVPRDDFGPILVPDNHLFMMGDNRENSQDSRYWGFLDINKVRGKALMIYWSWNQLESWVRFDRFGKILE